MDRLENQQELISIFYDLGEGPNLSLGRPSHVLWDRAFGQAPLRNPGLRPVLLKAQPPAVTVPLLVLQAKMLSPSVNHPVI